MRRGDYCFILLHLLDNRINRNFILPYTIIINNCRLLLLIENGKYIVAVVDKLAKKVITAYLTHRIKTGRIYEKD